MLVERQGHTATLLPDGQVLVTGGYSRGYFIGTAELYNPATGSWITTASLGTARGLHTATLLPDGKVLVVGGNHNTLNDAAYITLQSAELFDPVTKTWAPMGSLNAARSSQTDALLPSGQVLIAAGFNYNSSAWLTSAELYDSVAAPIALVNPVKLPQDAFSFAFTGVPNGINTVLASTNPAAPIADWLVLGPAPNFAPGLYVFRDPQVTNSPKRFYRVRSQ